MIDARILSENAADRELMEVLDHIFIFLRHELGNTVNSLKMTLEVLLMNYDSFDDKKINKFLKRALGEVVKQHRLLDAMKLYSITDIDVMEDISFISFWNSFLTLRKESMPHKNIKFKEDIPIIPCRIKADKMGLTQVLKQIVDNAADAVEDTNNPEIEIKVRRSNNYLEILIKDNGYGIHDDHFQKIFIPFFTTKEGKAGLGLPIAKKILTKMGGRIQIYNHPEIGTEARVWLKTMTPTPKPNGS